MKRILAALLVLMLLPAVSPAEGALPAERSPELAAYGYNELCLILDSFYGLKEAHRIGSFRSFFRANGYEEALLSADPKEADQAPSTRLPAEWVSVITGRTSTATMSLRRRIRSSERRSFSA